MTIAVHWITVLLILGLFATALLMGAAQNVEQAALLLSLHRSLGVSVWTLTVLRLLWRLTAARFPPFPSTMGALQTLTARVSEYALYLLLLVQPVTGAAQSLYRGKAFTLFLVWQVPPLVERDKDLVRLFHEIHERTAWALAALIGFHAAAALMHRLVWRDGVFESMWPGGFRKPRR
ncbi:MAG TPA: cytochrome b [Caulobacteraceae bacterium]